MVRDRFRRAMVWLGALGLCLPAAACGVFGPTDWLTARRVGPDLVLAIGGQCDPESYLSHLRLAPITGGRVSAALWEISARKPERATPRLTVGTPPEGFTELANNLADQPLAGTLDLTLRTNFLYSVTIDMAALASGEAVHFRPQPVMNENADVRPPRC